MGERTSRGMVSALIDHKIIPYVFDISRQPILFRELLKINKMYIDGTIEGKMPGFKLKLFRFYILFLLLWHLILLPLIAIFHSLLAKLDCHLSIILAGLATIIFFASFSIFKGWMIERVTLKLIKEAWRIHFPHFDYDKHASQVAAIYAKAEEQEIPRKELRLFVLNHLLSEKTPSGHTEEY